jgi:hypothetical protein
VFCKAKEYSPQRRKVRKEKLKIWDKDEGQKTLGTNFTPLTKNAEDFPRTKGGEDKD